MTQVDVSAIKDYQVCARLYDYRHGDIVYEPLSHEKLVDIRYQNTMKNILTFLFHKKQSGNQPTFDFLVKKWEKLWFPQDTTVQDIMSMKIGSKDNYNLPAASTIGVRALRNVYAEFDKDPGIPLLIEEEFAVSLDNGIKLVDHFDLVMKYKDYYHVIKWGANISKTQPSSLLLDFAALRYAFEFRNSERNIGKVRYSFVDLALPTFKYVDFSVPDEDIETLRYWSKAIASDGVFIPRRGLTTHCKVCAFDTPCSKFKLV